MTEDSFAEQLADWHQAHAEGTSTAGAAEARIRAAQHFLLQVDHFWSSPPAPASTSLPHRIGSIGRLQLRRVIGIGGFAIVYLAHDPLLNRLVAVKLPRPEVLLAPSARDRFAREAIMIAQLNHPNIVPIFDSGQLASGHYLVMAYCEKGTLADWLKGRSDPVPIRLAAALVAQLADAVQHAHDRQILHRDLKPSNILLELPTSPLDPDLSALAGQPRISDFGLSKMFEGAKALEPGGLTTGSAILGTPLYMAPEQIRSTGEEIGPAADVYSLGTILYELLTGSAPFEANNKVDTLRRVLDEEPPPLRRLRRGTPADLEAVCMKCLEKDPSKRHATAAALAADLHRYLQGEPTTTRPWSRRERAGRWLRRRRWVVASVTAILMVGGLGVAGIAWHLQEASRISGELDQAVQQAQEQRKQVTKQSKIAAEHEMKVARLNYEAQIRSAASFYHEGRFALAHEALHAAKLQVGDQDLRGFEWHWLNGVCRSVIYLRGRNHQPFATLALVGRDESQQCIALGEDKLIYTWDVNTGNIVRASPCDRWYESVDIADDGQRLAFWWRDANHKLFFEVRDPAGDILVRESFAFGPKTPSISARLHPQARYFVHSGPTLWDLVARAPIPLSTRGGEGEVLAQSFDSEGVRVAIARRNTKIPSGYNTIDFHNTQTGRMTGRRRIKFAPTEISIGAKDDKELVAARDAENRVAVWNFGLDADSKRLLHQIEPIPDLRCIRLSPSGRYLLVGSGSKRGSAPLLSLYKAETGMLLETFDEPDVVAFKLAFSKDEKRIAVGCSDGIVRVWRPKALDFARPAEASIWSHWPLPTTSIAFAPQGTYWAFGGEGGIVRLRSRNNSQTNQTLRPHTSMIGSVAFSLDSEWLATGGFDNKVVLRNLKTGQVHPPCEGHTDRVRSVAFSPDSKLLASAGSDGVVRIWDVRSGKAKGTLPGHADSIRSLAFAPKSMLLASASNDHVVRLWDVAGYRCLSEIKHTGQVWCVCFSPDERHLVTGGQDGILHVWDVRSLSLVHSMRGHQHGIRTASFSPDGRTIASGDAGGSIRLWSAATSQELVVFVRQPHAINHLAFSSDGRMLAAAIQDGTIRHWDVLP